jgi:AcrR family transcriptional regulator
MAVALKVEARARQPQQSRGRARFEQVLQEARKLLRAEGLNGFSIPALAERLDCPRASIYKFFPTPYAVLNELVQRYLAELEAQLTKRSRDVLELDWPEAMKAIVWEAVRFYNANPLARLLVLGGPVSDDSYRAQELTIQRLGNLTRELLLKVGVQLPKSRPDAATLLIEIGTSCLRVSQFLHGEITPEYREEAYQAMRAYLARYAAPPARRRS